MTLQTVLPEGWLDLTETMKRLGKSQSTVDRLVASREIATKLRPIPGRKPMRLYRQSDIEKLAEEATRREMRSALRHRAPQLNAPESARPLLPGTIAPDGKFIERVSILQKLWLTLEEAAAYSGLAESYLERAIREGKLRAVKGGAHGAWAIRRENLEGFEG